MHGAQIGPSYKLLNLQQSRAGPTSEIAVLQSWGELVMTAKPHINCNSASKESVTLVYGADCHL